MNSNYQSTYGKMNILYEIIKFKHNKFGSDTESFQDYFCF